MGTFTSSSLQVGEVYTRAFLKERFDIIDLTINTGVFRPKGHDSVWLFVTEQKSKDRTQYRDYLSGSLLEWDGQTSARTDSLIVEHRERGLELLLFYRKSKLEFPGAGFRYYGRVLYEVHLPGRPSHFLLKLEVPLPESEPAERIRARFHSEPPPVPKPSIPAPSTPMPIPSETAPSSILAIDSPSWLEALPAEIRTVFAHLQAHGAITEAELTRLLGSTRLARRFALQLDAWVKQVPFTVRVEATPGASDTSEWGTPLPYAPSEPNAVFLGQPTRPRRISVRFPELDSSMSGCCRGHRDRPQEGP